MIQIQFLALKPAGEVDSIVFSYGCDSQTVAVIGCCGPDFTVSSQTWPNEPLTVPPTCYPETVSILNLSNAVITIDSAWWADTIHFKAVSIFPVSLPRSATSVPFTIEYCPDSNSVTSPNRTLGGWFSVDVLGSDGKTQSPRFDTLVGWAAAPSGVTELNNFASEARIIPTDDDRSLEIILPLNIHGTINFELDNVLGERVLLNTWSARTQTVDASALPYGVYFYRLTAGPASQSGKVILGQ